MLGASATATAADDDRARARTHGDCASFPAAENEGRCDLAIELGRSLSRVSRFFAFSLHIFADIMSPIGTFQNHHIITHRKGKREGAYPYMRMPLLATSASDPPSLALVPSALRRDLFALYNLHA